MLESKRCSDCGTVKPVGDFYRDSNTRDGYRTYCVACSRIRNLASYQRGLRIVNDFRTPCVMCGESDLRVIEFHHIDPSTKRFQIAGAGRKRSMEELRAEVAKCVCLCANCHRRIHAGDELRYHAAVGE